MNTFDDLESEVRTYCRLFPTVFERAVGSALFDESGREYVDFFSGAGAVNYGHNNPFLKDRLIEYIQSDGITHSLDMATKAKREFIEQFNRVILQPRGLRYKMQFAGPTGTNAVEAALKLARKVTGRTNVLFFKNSYHGMTLGALAVTTNPSKRKGAGVPLLFTTSVPFEGDLGETDTIDHLQYVLDEMSGRNDLPAAAIVETVQAEGGIRPASYAWLHRLADLLRRYNVLLIVDDIQAGCGRTGTFFSFEPADLVPDMICLSKSISGLGLPMALVMIRPEIDIWAPGEHNGTFRGNNLAFVTGAAALEYWKDDSFSREIFQKGDLARKRLEEIAARYPQTEAKVRGRGLIQGLELAPHGLAEQVSRDAFQHGLLIEAVGPKDEVLKLLPPLVIEEAALERGLEILDKSVANALAGAGVRAAV